MDRIGKHSKITVDYKKNRLIIVLRGNIRKTDMESIYTDIRFGVQDLQPGFNVITDMRNCRIGYLTGAIIFKRIMEFLIEKEVGKIVRVSGTSQLLRQQMSRLSTTGYTPKYVNSLEEAEDFLNESEDPNSSS